MGEIILKSIIISLAIVGIRIVSSKGMILYFLRMPYEYLTGIKDDEKTLFCKICIYLLKPIIGCTTCMASVWTVAIDYLYFNNLDKWTVICIFAVACLNSIIYSVYENLEK